MTHSDFCRQQAAKAQSDADATKLDNVRDRCLRSMSAWTEMADRAERVAAEREVREAASAAARVM
ncbi:MAG: hypothetical protein ACSLE1_20890 [Sphingobium sp.]